MAQVDAVTVGRSRTALAALARRIRFEAAYLFGSRAEGKADVWSDIDIAVFAEGVEKWDISTRVRIATQIQKEAGDDIELHFFPADALRQSDPASFATYILKHGTPIETNVE